MRGLQIKEETFASLSISGFEAVEMYNSSAKPELPVSYTSNFILQGVTESRQEKFQPITTFGATYGFFFGEQPRMMSFQAVLLNTADFQWEIEWWANYEDHLRGTKLVDASARCYMTYDDVILEGYITGAQTSKNAQTPHEVPLTFTMWVTAVEYLVTPGDPEFPDTEEGSQVIDFAGANDFIQNEVGDFVSTTGAVRAANLTAALAGPVGILGKLRATLADTKDFLGEVGKAIDNAIALLYGRNLVIPAGFAGSERASGKALIVTQDGRVLTTDIDPNDLGSFVYNIRLPIDLGDPEPRSVFYDNIDEYPIRAGRQYYDRLGLTQLDENGDLGIYWQSYLAGGDPTVATGADLDAMATDAAEAAFGEFGIKVTNIEGKANSALARAMGRAAYAALNLGASASGASQAAASLTVGNVVGGGTL
jgi:hypothetical protein